MKRQIVSIDQDKCNGCGQCAKRCTEGAIKMVNGKAVLAGELFCDGFGACVGECPAGAITIEEKEAQPYNELKVIEHIAASEAEVVSAHLAHLREHGQTGYLRQAEQYLKTKGMLFVEGSPAEPCCPHSDMKPQGGADDVLKNWPIQLRLARPESHYFKGSELVIAADCVSFAFAGFHDRFLQGKPLIIFCPKLDKAYDEYVEKLASIFKTHGTERVSVVHMEVPCCSGAVKITEDAARKSGRNIVIKDYTISVGGKIV